MVIGVHGVVPLWRPAFGSCIVLRQPESQGHHIYTVVTTGSRQGSSRCCRWKPRPPATWRSAPGHAVGNGERGTGPFADHPAADLIPESPWAIVDTNLYGGIVHDRRRPADMLEKIT